MPSVSSNLFRLILRLREPSRIYLDDPLGRVEHDEQAVAPGVVGEAGGILADAPDDHRPLGQGVLVEARRLLRLAKRLAKQQACRCD